MLHTAKPEPTVVAGYLADPTDAALAKLLLDPAIGCACWLSVVASARVGVGVGGGVGGAGVGGGIGVGVGVGVGVGFIIIFI